LKAGVGDRDRDSEEKEATDPLIEGFLCKKWQRPAVLISLFLLLTLSLSLALLAIT